MLSKSEKGRMSLSWSVVSCCGIMVKGLNSASFLWIPEPQPRGCGNALLWDPGLFPLEKAILVQFAVVFTCSVSLLVGRVPVRVLINRAGEICLEDRRWWY